VSYASLTDLYSMGLPLASMGTVTTQQQQDALDAASSFIDAKLRARYGNGPGASGPLLVAPFDPTIVRACAEMAAHSILVRRGFNPANPADRNIIDRKVAAERYLDQVERQSAHPIVNTNNVQSPANDAPRLISMPLQGWHRHRWVQ